MPTDMKGRGRLTAPTTLLLGAALCALQVFNAACASSGNVNTSTIAGGSTTSASPAASPAATAAASPAGSPAATGKGFTEAEVAEIKAILTGADPAKYRVTLPEFQNGVAVGTMTLGTMPLTEVERIASARGAAAAGSPHQGGSTVIPYERGTIIIALSSPDISGGKDAARSPTSGNTQGPDYVGAERVNKIEAVLSRVDKSRYVFIH